MELRVLAVARIRLVKEENREGEIERRFGQSWWFRERERERVLKMRETKILR